MNRKALVVGSFSLLGLAATLGLLIHRKRKKEEAEKDQSYQKFRDQLEHREEPEKIKRAVLQQAFDPDYWRKVEGSREYPIIKESEARQLAQKIKDAWNGGTFWDDLEEDVYEAFENTKLKTYADISRLADQYQRKELAGEELWAHLKYKLSESEFAKVKSIVIKKMPI